MCLLRKLALFVIALSSFSFFFSCNKKSSTPALYDAQDTVIVYDMINDYMKNIKSGDFDRAIGMLAEITDSTITTVPEKIKKSLRNQYMAMPVLDYSITDVDWTNQDPIIVTCKVKFMEVEEGSDIPNSYNVSLSPIRKNGKWYLRLCDGYK